MPLTQYNRKYNLQKTNVRKTYTFHATRSNCKIVRHFENERVAMASSSVLVSLTLSRVLKHGGQVGHLVKY